MTTLDRDLAKIIKKKEQYFLRAQKLVDLIPNLEDQRIREQFIVQLNTIETTRSLFEEALDKINDIKLELNPECEPDYSSLNTFEEMYCKIMVAQAKLINEANPHPIPQNQDENNSAMSINALSFLTLPPLNVTPFDGTICNWPRFKETFTSVIIQNRSLDDVQRMHYLQSYTTSKAKQVIESFNLTANNFYLAWEALIKRYQSDRKLADHYIQKLINFDTPPQKATLTSLQEFLNKYDDNYKGLKQVTIPEREDYILFSLAVRQLDLENRRRFEAQIGETAFPTLSKLITYVQNQCHVLEVTAPLETPSTSSTRQDLKNKFKSKENKKFVGVTAANSTANNNSNVTAANSTANNNNSHITAYHSASTAQLKCEYCTQNYAHSIYACTAFRDLTVDKRMEFIKSKKGCTNCLSFRHTFSRCSSTKTCFSCGRRHHSLLHYPMPRNAPALTTNTPNAGSVSGGSTTAQSNAEKLQQQNVTAATTALNLTAHESTAIETSQNLPPVVLGTAQACLQNSQGKFRTVRILLDCASTVSLVTSDCAKRFNLPVQGTKQSLAGLGSVTVAEVEGFTSCIIKPCHSNGPQISLTALVVNQESILSVRSDVSYTSEIINRFINLPLADPLWYKPDVIDLLLGTDVFLQILEPTLLPSRQVGLGVLPTIFGHVIMGPATLNQIYNNTAKHELPILTTQLNYEVM